MKKCFLAGLLLLASGCTPEPLYEGRPLRYWKQELKSNSPTARYRAASSLADVGPKAKVAIPELIDCLHDDEFRIVFAAAKALGNIGPDAKEAVPALTELRNHKIRNVRDVAEQALEKIDTEATRSRNGARP
jgi:HEAT repeat protein